MTAVKSISSWKVAVNLVREYNEISERFAEPMSDDEMDRFMERQGELQEKIDHIDAWYIDSRLEMTMDELRCFPGDTPIMDISSRQMGYPALFPEELPHRLIHSYTLKGDVVLDTFVGSRTTFLSAIKDKRSYVGYDVDPVSLFPFRLAQ